MVSIARQASHFKTSRVSCPIASSKTLFNPREAHLTEVTTEWLISEWSAGGSERATPYLAGVPTLASPLRCRRADGAQDENYYGVLPLAAVLRLRLDLVDHLKIISSTDPPELHSVCREWKEGGRWGSLRGRSVVESRRGEGTGKTGADDMQSPVVEIEIHFQFRKNSEMWARVPTKKCINKYELKM